MTHYVLDVRRMLCPMPVIRTQQRVADLVQGDTLDVICTDPGVKNDIPAWCRINKHTVLGLRNINNEVIISIKVGGS